MNRTWPELTPAFFICMERGEIVNKNVSVLRQ